MAESKEMYMLEGGTFLSVRRPCQHSVGIRWFHLTLKYK
jgi:hypothetical protein